MTVLAYIDPGTGLLIWQTIIAAFVGLVFYLKKTRSWILNQFCKIFGDKTKPGNTTPEESQTDLKTGR